MCIRDRDRGILAKRLNISPHQLSYVTNSGEGEGLLFYGNVILPFIDRFPIDTEPVSYTHLLHGLSDFLYQFIGGRGIRRTLHVVLMGFAYVVVNNVPRRINCPHSKRVKQ